jgi:hypothetical protein
MPPKVFLEIIGLHKRKPDVTLTIVCLAQWRHWRLRERKLRREIDKYFKGK